MRNQAIEKLAVVMCDHIIDNKDIKDRHLLNLVVKMRVITDRNAENEDACASVIREIMNGEVI